MTVARIQTDRVRAGFARASTDGISPLLLEKLSLLLGLETEDLRRLARETQCQLVARDTVVFRQGDPADSVYVVLDGAVRLEHRDPDGSIETHDVVGPHTPFGDVAMLGEPIRYYTAVATSGAVFLRIPLQLLRDVLADYPQLATWWAYSVAATLGHRSARLTDSLRARLTKRTATLLDAA